MNKTQIFLLEIDTMAMDIHTGFDIEVPSLGTGLMQKLTASILAARQADMAARGNLLADNLSDDELARRGINPLPYRYGFG